MARVVVTGKIPQVALESLRQAHDVVAWEESSPISRAELLTRVKGADALVTLLTEKVDGELLDAAGPQLKSVSNVAVGYNNIDVAAARRHGILVANTPGVLDETTADTAFLLILAACRLAHEAEDDLRSGRWHGWGINQYMGLDVHGATLGIVGFGRIGQAMARRARGFGMRVL